MKPFSDNIVTLTAPHATLIQVIEYALNTSALQHFQTSLAERVKASFPGLRVYEIPSSRRLTLRGKRVVLFENSLCAYQLDHGMFQIMFSKALSPSFRAFHIQNVHDRLSYIKASLVYLPRQLREGHLLYGAVDVRGDGWCGYYALGLLEYLTSGKTLTRERIKEQLDIKKGSIQPPHWLETYEFGMFGVGRFNVGVFIKRGDYILEVVCYSKKVNTWVFPILIGNSHYQLVCRKINGRLRVDYTNHVASQVFRRENASYPNHEINPIEYLKTFEPVQDLINI